MIIIGTSRGGAMSLLERFLGESVSGAWSTTPDDRCSSYRPER